jgi:hypothetical protein
MPKETVEWKSGDGTLQTAAPLPILKIQEFLGTFFPRVCQKGYTPVHGEEGE